MLRTDYEEEINNKIIKFLNKESLLVLLYFTISPILNIESPIYYMYIYKKSYL